MAHPASAFALPCPVLPLPPALPYPSLPLPLPFPALPFPAPAPAHFDLFK